jgi:hypothetical protein
MTIFVLLSTGKGIEDLLLMFVFLIMIIGGIGLLFHGDKREKSPPRPTFKTKTSWRK